MFPCRNFAGGLKLRVLVVNNTVWTLFTQCTQLEVRDFDPLVTARGFRFSVSRLPFAEMDMFYVPLLVLKGITFLLLDVCSLIFFSGRRSLRKGFPVEHA